MSGQEAPPQAPESFKGPVRGDEVFLAFFLFFLLSFVVGQFIRILFPPQEGQGLAWQLAAAQIPLQLVVVFFILRLRRLRAGASGLAALGWNPPPPPWKGIAQGLLWYLPMGISWWTLTILYMLALKALGVAPPKQAVLSLFREPGIPFYAVVLLWITTCCTAPLAEELLFRGSLYSWIRAKLTFWPTALITALAFALPHGGWKFVVPLGYLAVMLAWLREKSGSVWPSIGLHAAHNFSTLLLVTLVPSPESLGFFW